MHAPESGAAPHTFAVPPPAQVSGDAQSPQSRSRPHPSPMRPQYVPPTCMHVSGAHPSMGMLHTFCTQSRPPAQSLQSRMPPQPLPILPQYVAASVLHVMGVQSPGETSRGGGGEVSRVTMFEESGASLGGGGPPSVSPPVTSSGLPPQPAMVTAATIKDRE